MSPDVGYGMQKCCNTLQLGPQTALGELTVLSQITIITITFCCNNLWKSKFMALEKPGKLRVFPSPTLWPPINIA